MGRCSDCHKKHCRCKYTLKFQTMEFRGNREVIQPEFLRPIYWIPDGAPRFQYKKC